MTSIPNTPPVLPDGFKPGCSNWRCQCWIPRPVCEKFMGFDGWEHCPRCGWSRELHQPDPPKEEDADGEEDNAPPD